MKICNILPPVAYLLIAYYVVEFADYIVGIISYYVSGEYSSHKARLGARNKTLYCIATAVMVFAIEGTKILLKQYGYDIDAIGDLLSFTWLSKMVITELSSVLENYRRINK